MSRRRQVILVTGTPRSGTTPVGDTLASAPRTRTLYEPLNYHVGDRRVGRYFEVPGAAGCGPEFVDRFVDDVRRLRLDLRPGLFPEDQGVRRAVKRVTGSRTLVTYRRARVDPAVTTLVWKDPFAAFFAERVADRHGVPVVVTLRPPYAVAASFKRLGWGFDVAGLVKRLREAGGRDYEHLLDLPDLEMPVPNATALWFVVNATLLEASHRVPTIHLVDLDGLVEDPIEGYRRLFDRVGLPWHRRVERRLERSHRRRGPSRPTRQRAHVARRDVSAVNRYWTDMLTADETQLVDEVTVDLWDELRGRAGS